MIKSDNTQAVQGEFVDNRMFKNPISAILIALLYLGFIGIIIYLYYNKNKSNLLDN